MHRTIMTLAEFERRFPDDDACKAYLAHHRWPDGVRCPRCGNARVSALKRKWHWACSRCGKSSYRFSILVGTIFQNAHRPLHEWFKMAYLMRTSGMTVTPAWIQRQMGFGAPATAWYMVHRIQVALKDPAMCDLLGFTVQNQGSAGDTPSASDAQAHGPNTLLGFVVASRTGPHGES